MSVGFAALSWLIIKLCHMNLLLQWANNGRNVHSATLRTTILYYFWCQATFCQAALYHHPKDKTLLTTMRFGFIKNLME